DPERLKGCGAVIHLAGEPIAARRWSEAQKKKISDSRVCGTRALAEALAGLTEKPECLVCASAIGFYGNRGEEVLRESSASGEGFLAEVVRDWEAAADPAREAGIRVVHLRIGIVLSPQGGALAKMLPPFRWGLGGPLGNGRMWMSWIHLEDAARAFVTALQSPALQGAFNLCAPNPVRNAEFTRSLASALHRPAFLPAPAPLLRLALGEMAEALLLGSTRCVPAGLVNQGFEFEYPELQGALESFFR
ncbi:MAG: TIGR01777 family oxidoreductase, partial [Kiritimatiellia bacterium]